jgi:hypothetical protein
LFVAATKDDVSEPLMNDLANAKVGRVPVRDPAPVRDGPKRRRVTALSLDNVPYVTQEDDVEDEEFGDDDYHEEGKVQENESDDD